MPSNGDGGSKSRNVPRKLAALEVRVSTLEKNLPGSIAKLVTAAIGDSARRAIGAALRRLCETFPYDDQ